MMHWGRFFDKNDSAQFRLQQELDEFFCAKKLEIVKEVVLKPRGQNFIIWFQFQPIFDNSKGIFD